MSTLTVQQIQSKQRKNKLADLALQMISAVQQSMYDFVVTFFALVVALIAVFSTANGNADLITWGMFVIISVYLILLIIRIIHRTDESFTNDEIASMLADMAETLDRIERNS